jgi:hypothetical protein
MAVGDLFLDTATADVYVKTGTSPFYVKLLNIKGPAGANSNSNAYSAKVSLTTAQSISSTTAELVFGTKLWDTASLVAAGNSRMALTSSTTVATHYILSAYVLFASNPNGDRLIYLETQSGGVWSTVTVSSVRSNVNTGTALNLSALVYVPASSPAVTVPCRVTASATGGSVNVIAATFSAQRVGYS